jgi:hypothetical protein
VRVAVRDAAVLGALRPLDVAAYLRSAGWRPVDRIGDKGTVWTRAGASGEDLEILLPLRADLRDFTARMADVLTTLAAGEDRSQLDILRDISCASADVVRLELQGPAVIDQSLALPQGVLAFARAHELMLSAACAAVEPRPVYATRKPAQAVEYVSRLRLGQTEAGSYVVSILSPVAPSLDQGAGPGAGGEVEDPFERRVTTTLARASAAALDAAEVAGSTGSLQPFVDASRLGVSANLCDAIAGLVTESGAESLAIRLRWSPSRAAPAEAPSRVVFARDAVGVVREASRIFRETTPREEFELQGMVVALQRDEGAASGTVTIAALVDGALRKVRVALGAEAYGAAIRAHQEELRVRCLGRLTKEGRSLVLREAHGLEVEAGE